MRGQLRMRGGNAGRIAGPFGVSFIVEQRVGLVALQYDIVRLQRADANLAPAGVDHNRHARVQRLGCMANAAQRGGVRIDIAVRHVQARHIHAGRNHLAQRVAGIAGRADGGDDLGLSEFLARCQRTGPGVNAARL